MFKKVLDHFRQICSIPHGSGHTKLLSDHCVRFAEKHGLEHYRDDLGNVVIYKKGTKGYETSPAVIIQGHLDMVCVKTDECDIGFEKEGLTLHEDDDFIEAVGTSLGGDDGIAIAYALTVLESEDLAHPPLEVVFTVDEETGMYGAEVLETSVLSGKMIINIDSEEEDTLLVSCAGSVRADAQIKTEFEKAEGHALKISLSGFAGGHSGTEIDKGRLNAVITLAKILGDNDINLVSFSGGSADNAIAASSSAVITTNKPKETTEKIISSFEKIKSAALSEDSDMDLKIEDHTAQMQMTKGCTKKILNAVAEVPNGVIAMSEKIDGLVQTSLNLGIIKTDENSLEVCHALRSSIQKEKDELAKRLERHYEKHGFSVKFHSSYPGWEYKENSRLQKVIAEAYKENFGEEMKITAIHAGLECGIFCDKIKDLDCVSMGPNIFDIHSTEERLSKKSAEKVFKLLVSVLAQLT